MATQSVCSFNKFGYCKFGEVCRKKHVKELCELTSCDGKSCPQRHPRECKFLRNIGYCKFGEWCQFSHILKKDPDLENLKKENLSILTKLEQLEKLLFEKDKQIESIIESIGELNKIKKGPAKKSFKCTKCDFESNSQTGLKVHDKKKHTSVENLKFPKICDFCDEELKTAIEMKKHMRTHSYKEARFKCDDCDFVGQNELTMDVHIGKHHSEKYECGLCEFEANNQENLEIHLISCEMYQCVGCSEKFKSIKEVKNHIVEMHNSNGCHYVTHLKLDRNNPCEVDQKTYRSTEI